jgi:hypothetical protein
MLSSTHFYKQISLQLANLLFRFFWHMNLDVSLQSSFLHLSKDCYNLYLSLKFQRNMIILILNQKFNRTMKFYNLNNNDRFLHNQIFY